jgi:hypothetical protein
MRPTAPRHPVGAFILWPQIPLILPQLISPEYLK